MNGNEAKWKELADRAETRRNTLCKHMGIQMLGQVCYTFMQ
jgi:hypothetical protein